MKKRKAKTRYYTEYTYRPGFPYDSIEAHMVWREDYRGRVTYRIKRDIHEKATEWGYCSYRKLPTRGMEEIGVVKAKKILGIKRIND